MKTDVQQRFLPNTHGRQALSKEYIKRIMYIGCTYNSVTVEHFYFVEFHFREDKILYLFVRLNLHEIIASTYVFYVSEFICEKYFLRMDSLATLHENNAFANKMWVTRFLKNIVIHVDTSPDLGELPRHCLNAAMAGEGIKLTTSRVQSERNNHSATRILSLKKRGLQRDIIYFRSRYMFLII